jgi:hypothetical protein
LQQAYYAKPSLAKPSLPDWTVQHPYENPLGPLTWTMSVPDHSSPPRAVPWYEADRVAVDYPWFDLEESLQWRAFQRAVEILQQRGNRVFVLVGPFNEHMLTPTSLQRYQKVKATIGAWLQVKQISHAIPGVLAREQYGDASHPLASGYAALARQLGDHAFFRSIPSREP